MSPTSSTLNRLVLHQNALNLCLCSILITLDVVSSLFVAQTQIARDPDNPFVTFERNTYAPAHSSISISSSSTSPRPHIPTTNAIPTTTATKGESFYGTRPNGYVQQTTTQHPPQQPKFLKFTLIAGKYWKFNIKTNSLQTSHNEKELRLHRNLSSNNFIIDDDGWFQYNFQQQQLFAWPSYYSKPATYYFALLPSGLDYEADGENVINSTDIVANIVVELIRPYISSKLDIEQLVDHKFSLEYLHRYSGYPLLLTQIVSIFDIFARNIVTGQSPAYPSTSNQTTTTTTTAATTTSLLSSLVQSKQARYTNRLAEFLLLDSHSTPDGEYFSITWTTHPSLVNNTISPINDCRFSTINDTVSRLSSRSIVYADTDDKFVIPFSLEGPLANSQAIIPTERGSYALKLILNPPCRRRKIIEELGIASAPGAYIGLSADIDDRENSVLDQHEASLNSSKSYESISTNERITTSATDAGQSIEVTSTYSGNKAGLPTTPQNIATAKSQETEAAYGTRYSIQVPHLLTTTDQSVDLQTSAIGTSPASTQPTTLLAGTSSDRLVPAIEPNLSAPSSQSISNTRRALDPPTTQIPANQHLQSKSQPQAKSYINFLDSLDTKISSIMAANETSYSTTPNSLANNITTTLPPTVTTDTSTLTPGKDGQESSLNDDLIGILNEIMEFLISIAIPLSVILGLILISSISAAILYLCHKRRKSKQFAVGDRFKFRYESERRGFLKKSSKPVILEADQKSLSAGSTPLHKPLPGTRKNETDKMLSNKADTKSKASKKSKKSGFLSGQDSAGGSSFFAMSHLNTVGAGNYGEGGFSSVDCGGDGGFGDGGGGCDGGGGGGGDCS